MSRRPLRYLALALFLSLAPQLAARAWHAAGHSMVASIALKSLNTHDRAAVVALLAQHPDVNRLHWRSGVAGSGLTEGEIFFMRASTWPDEVRPRPGQPPNPENHPDWHFVNLPIDRPGTRPHALPVRHPQNLFDTDILQALSLCAAIARAPNSTPADKAKAISWTIHLVGDLHQPLHASALLSDDFPSGDHGGNLFKIKPGDGFTELHGYWDGRYDELRSPGTVSARAAAIAQANPAHLRPEVADLRPTTWAGESKTIAESFVYKSRNVDLQPGAANPLPDTYKADALTQTDPRIAVGGYRLARVLHQLLQPGPPVNAAVLQAFRNPASLSPVHH